MERVRSSSDIAPALPMRERADRPAGAMNGAFREQLSLAHVGQFNERLEQGLADLEQLGSRLAESQSFEDLKRYKQRVATLMRDLTNHMVQVRTELDWDTQTWEQRTLVTIRRVDEELEKLADMVLGQEKDHLAILSKMGEIKGLILDMKM